MLTSFQQPDSWQNSQLSPSRAVSVCEIVNRPDLFVSSTPHYVVDQIQWIQCRYLYVQVNPTTAALDEPFPGQQSKNSEGNIPQDPSRYLIGPGEKPFEVPLAAVSAWRRAQLPLSAPAGLSEDPEQMIEADENSAEGDQGDDVKLLDSASEESGEYKQPPASDSTAESDAADEIGGFEAEGAREPKSSSEFRPGALDRDSLPKLPAPVWVTSSPHALHALTREVRDLQKKQSQTAARDLGWYMDMDKVDNLFHWIFELHSFDAALPLAEDMARMGRASIVLELRFGADFPLSPPFVRVVRPRLLPLMLGGGGHVTAGGTVCSELLTGSGWSPALTMEKVLLQVRLGLCDLDPPARLDDRPRMRDADYAMADAAAAYRRAAAAHGWRVPADVDRIASMSWA